ncbi:MAG: ComEC/Rec2 family competence protein [Henriciella sp.]|nr:ComEC/Rec2 family competence protein [Henriciella sp.]
MLVGLAVVLRRRGLAPPLILAILVAMIGGSGGALAGKLATLRVSDPMITRMIGPVMIEGWVEEVEPAKRGVRLRLTVHAIDEVAPDDLPARVRVTHTTRLKVEAGRFVRCWAVLRPPPGPIVKGDYAFDRQAYFEGLGAVGYVQGRCRGGALGAPKDARDRLVLWVAKHRRNFAHYVNRAAGERAGGFAAALASGDRSFMDVADQQALRGSGLAHLLAISGLHMGIIGGLVYVLVWRGLALIEPIAVRIPVQKPAAVAALTASLIYLILSGASVSTQRAFIMAMVLFGAVLVDRTSLSLRSLAIAMIIVVIISPWSVLTPGFQMSFAATGALIATYEAWQRRRRTSGRNEAKSFGFWLKSIVVTSLVSDFATMPFAFYHFDRIAGMGVFANLLAMPIISVASAPLAGAAMVMAPFGLSEYPLRAFGYTLEGVLWVAHTFDNLTPDGINFDKRMPGQTLLLFTGTLVLGIVLQGWRKRLGFAGVLFVAGVGFWITSPAASVHWAPSGEVFLVDQSGAVDRISFVKGGGLAPLRFIDEAMGADCSKNICQRQIAGVQITTIPDGISPTCSNTTENAMILIGTRDFEPIDCLRRFIRWSDVATSRGLSWQIIAGQAVEVDRPPCGERPWHACLSD